MQPTGSFAFRIPHESAEWRTEGDSRVRELIGDLQSVTIFQTDEQHFQIILKLEVGDPYRFELKDLVVPLKGIGGIFQWDVVGLVRLKLGGDEVASLPFNS